MARSARQSYHRNDSGISAIICLLAGVFLMFASVFAPTPMGTAVISLLGVFAIFGALGFASQMD